MRSVVADSADRTSARSDIAPDGATLRRVALALLTIGALLLRIRYLGLAMRVDESYSYTAYAARPLSYGLTHYTGNNHLFHTLLVYLTTRTLWNSPVIIRLPALAAGVALVPATYRMASRLFSTTTGLIAAALVAVSPPLVAYSVNARGYGIVALAFVLLIWLAPTLVRSERLWPWWVYAGVATIGFYTIPVMAFAFGGYTIWLIATVVADRSVDRRRFAGRWIIFTALAGAATIALYTPVFAVAGAKAVFQNPYAAPVSFRTWRAGLPHLAADTWSFWNDGVPSVLAGLIAVAFVAGLFRRRDDASRVPVAIPAIAWIMIQIAVQRVLPAPRIWLFGVPVYLATAAAGIAWALEAATVRMRSAALVPALAIVLASVLAASVVGFRPIERSHESGRLPDAEAVTRYLAAHTGRRVRVLAVTPAQDPLRYYVALHGLDVTILDRPLRNADRLIVVVDTWEHGSLAAALRGTSAATVSPAGVVSVRAFGPPLVLRRFPTATLYEFDRLTSR